MKAETRFRSVPSETGLCLQLYNGRMRDLVVIYDIVALNESAVAPIINKGGEGVPRQICCNGSNTQV